MPQLSRCLLLALTLCALPMARADADDPPLPLVGCDQADNQVELTASARLDPSCTWTRGVEITASDVVLDCQGARIVTTDKRYGVHITAPTDVALSNITVRNCYIEGFLNNVHIERNGFRDLAAGAEYDHAFSNIVVEDTVSMRSRGVGVYVDGYVTGVTLRRLHVKGAGSTGIYLEEGSKDNTVEDSDIVDNGYSENGPSGQLFQIGTSYVWFWGTGREGLAIDGSRSNHILNNRFSGNSAGGIFLYKNCGEFVHQKPERWFFRRYGADGNTIEGNTFTGGENGIWIAARMGENTLPMDCSDAQYAPGYSLDYAADTAVHANTFQNVTYGVRVEDDGASVTDNQFTSDNAAHQAILIGTQQRTAVLGLAVDRVTISGNRSTIAGNTNPYRWLYGQTNTTFADNQALGRPVGLCQGQPPNPHLFVFVVALAPVPDPSNPPTGLPSPTPTPPIVPPCGLDCTRSASVTRPSLTVRSVAGLPEHDSLAFSGQLTVSQPFDPTLDPASNGIGLLVNGADATQLLNVVIPGGAYDRATRIGWKTARGGGRWRYVNGSAAAPGGIARVTIADLSQRQPGLLQFSVQGRAGTYPMEPATLPLAATVVLDPPTAETGQCGAASFADSAPHCRVYGAAVRCR